LGDWVRGGLSFDPKHFSSKVLFPKLILTPAFTQSERAIEEETEKLVSLEFGQVNHLCRM
jgi:hypothetical protein